MIHEKMQQVMNEQIKNELYSSYLYLAMSAYFTTIGLDGFANWMRVQALEEGTHALKFFDHIGEREGRVHLMTIDQPQAEWSSPLDAFKAAYKHEQFISGKINDLVRLANELGEFASLPMLNWFVAEQVEEESSAAKIVQTLELLGKDGPGLVMLDKDLGARVFTPPTQEN